MQQSFLPFAVAFAIATGGPALADTANLRFDDLDLSTAAGKATFGARIEHTLRTACPAQVVTGSRIAHDDGTVECKRDVRKQIAAQLAARGATGRLAAQVISRSAALD